MTFLHKHCTSYYSSSFLVQLQVHSVAPSPNGQWLASGSADGTAKVWEVSTGRCLKTFELQGKVKCVAWCPNSAYSILAATANKSAYLLSTGKLYKAL